MRSRFRFLLVPAMLLSILILASCNKVKLDQMVSQIRVEKIAEKNDQLFLFNGKNAVILRNNSAIAEFGGVQVVLPDRVFRDNNGVWHLAMRSVEIVNRVINPVRNRVNTIVIDPGHGGKDPGALSVTRKNREKALNLDLALRLGSALQNAGFTVLYTRNDDSTVALEKRGTAFQADLFVSIHHNSSSNISASGAETFCLMSDRKKVDDKILNAVNIAVSVQKNQSSASGTYGRGVKFANFRVLRDAECPAILFETGFISNPDDEKKCLSVQWRQLMADALAKGIIQAVSL